MILSVRWPFPFLSAVIGDSLLVKHASNINTRFEETMKPSLLIGLCLIVAACFGLSCNDSPDAASGTIEGAPTEADVEQFIRKKKKR